MMLFMMIIVLALFLAGILMSQMVKNTYMEQLDDSEQQLLNVAQETDVLVSYYNAGVLDRQDLARNVTSKAAVNSLVIWVVNRESGKIVMSADREQTAFTGSQLQSLDIYKQMIAAMQNGSAVKTVTKENNIFNTPVITVAKPVVVDNQITDYVFVHKRISELESSLMDIYRQIVLSAAISAALGIVLTYIFTRNMLRPLKVVNTGAKMLANGNLDVYLEVRSTDEIGQFAETFNAVAKQLKKNERTRQSFVANVSHELRSPLTSIQGLVQGVLDGTVAPEDSEHYLGIVLDETKRLNLLITDLLDLAKVESGQFPLEITEIEINEMIRRVLIMYEKKVEDKNLNVEVLLSGDKVMVYGDPNRLIQVLQNLIDNAVKFASQDGRLRISTLETDASVFVSINNSGEVIPRAEIPYVFDRFYKADKARSRSKGGTGIGLSLVRRILEEHRQKIWVESDAVEGTTFTFTLKKV